MISVKDKQLGQRWSVFLDYLQNLDREGRLKYLDLSGSGRTRSHLDNKRLIEQKIGETTFSFRPIRAIEDVAKHLLNGFVGGGKRKAR